MAWKGAGKPCFGYQLKTCRGACVGVEAPLAHDARLIEALSSLKLAPWPYRGPVGIIEGEDMLLVDQWRYLGTIRGDAEDEVSDRLANATPPAFDADIYALLRKHLGRRVSARVPGHLPSSRRRVPVPDAAPGAGRGGRHRAGRR